MWSVHTMGSMWMKKISDRIVDGKATPEDIQTLEDVAYQIDGRTVCAFGEASAWPVEAIISKFRDELTAETSEDNDYLSDEAKKQLQFISQ